MIKLRDGSYQLSKKVSQSLPGHKLVAVNKLCEMGWLYRQIHQYTEKAGQETAGLVSQSFVTAVREEMTEYYRLLAGLEQSMREGGVRLLQLMVWTRQPQARLRLLVEVVTSVGLCKGGALVTKLYSFLSQGDPELGQCVATLLSASCRPLYSMLVRWILDGELEDPYNEFFITGEVGVQGESLWHHKYSISLAMMPKFLTQSWAKKILSTGKSINFLHSVCGDSGPVESRAGLVSKLQELDPASLFRGEVDNPLLETVQQLYTLTARHVLDIMFNKFQLMSHLAALRYYINHSTAFPPTVSLSGSTCYWARETS